MGLDFKLAGAAAFALLILCFSVSVSANGDDSYLRVYVPDHINPNSTVFVAGEAFEGGSAAHLNITVRVTNTTNSSVCVNSSNTNPTTGIFNMSITLPNFEGEFTVSVNSNSSILIEKNLTVDTSFFQGASLEFIGNQPPFAPGDSITIKTTAKYQNTTGLGSSYTITMGIYSGNGKIAGPGDWGAEQANATISDGTTTHSFTISSSAESGEYVADMYGKHMVFTVKKYSVSGLTLDNNSQSSAYFPPSNNVSIRTKIKNSTGDPQTGAAVDAVIVYPNGTETDPITLTNTSEGIYDYNYTLPPTTGTYTIRINTTIGSTTEETSSTFTVEDVKLSLERSSLLQGGMMMFDMWGGNKVISPGTNASFDIKVFNLATGAFLPVRTTTGAKGVNCSAVEILDVINAETGANVTASVTANDTSATTSLKFMGEDLCTVTFLTPAIAGIYKLTLNVTVNSSSTFDEKSVTGYFTTQNYRMKVIPVSVMGRDKFHVMLKPGKNASFKIEVRNISAKSTLTTPNISNVEVTALTSMGEFSFGGATDTTGISYWYDSGSRKITVYIPDNFTGPTLLKVKAIYQVTGTQNETMTGDGFFFSKYVMGFVGPQFGGAMDMGGGEMSSGGGDPGGGPMGMGGTAMSCTQMMEFQGFVMDVETGQTLESVIISKGTIREEFTGRDVSACFTVVGGGSKTDSNGQASINMTFDASTGCPYSAATQLSGFYFTIWDVALQNYTDSLPGGFECKNFNFWPSMTNWEVGVNSSVNFTIQNVVYMNNMSKYVTNGTVGISRVINFDPSKGPTVLDLSNVSTKSFEGYNTTYTISPNNFTNLVASNNNRWYSGFYDVMIQVCDNNNTNNDSDDTCDTSFGGFGVFSFKAYMMSNIWGSDYAWMPGETKTLEIFSEHNITQNVSIKRMNFMTGEDVEIPLIQNRTSNVTHNGVEGVNITVNFTLPTSLEKGDGMIMFELTDANGDKMTTDTFAQISTFQLISPQAVWPDEPSMQYPRMNLKGGYAQINSTINITNPENWSGTIGQIPVWGSYVITEYLENLTTDLLRWNLTYIMDAYSIESSSGQRTLSQQNDAEGWGDYCVFESIWNSTEQFLVINNGTPGDDDITFTHMFIKHNGTNGTNPALAGATLRGPFVPNNYLGGGLYLQSFEYCLPMIFSSNETHYTDMFGQDQTEQYWSTQWGWGGRHRKDSNFTIPFIVQWVNGSADVGANVTITQIAGANFDKKGFTAPLTAGDFAVRDNTTDANGVALVTLNITTSGMYRPFWWVNSSSGIEEAAGFDNALMLQVSAFECYSQWATGTGTGMEGVMVNQTDASTPNVTGTIFTSYFNMSSLPNANISLYYMDFSTYFGPPTQTALSLGSDLYYPNDNGSIMPTTDVLATNSSGQLTVMIKPSEGWPTSNYGPCVEVEGNAEAPLTSGASTEHFFIGRVCSYPTGEY